MPKWLQMVEGSFPHEVFVSAQLDFADYLDLFQLSSKEYLWRYASLGDILGNPFRLHLSIPL